MASPPYNSVLLVDGSNVLHAVLHTGMADLKSEAGEFGGAFGFLRSLRFILSRQTVNRCVAFWDGSLSVRRREILPEYKKRDGEDEDAEKVEHRTLYQVARNVLVQLLPLLGVPCVYERDHEADDLIYCARNLGRDLGWRRFTVCSEDKDFYQLIDRDTEVYRPIRKIQVERATFIETTGLPLLRYMLFRSICGDKSDGIPGIHLVGEKTAHSLCESLSKDVFTSQTVIDWGRFVEECEVQSGKKIERIVDGLDIVQRNMELMALDREELPEAVVERVLKAITTPRANRLDEAYEVLDVMEFYSITHQYDHWSIPFLRVSVG